MTRPRDVVKKRMATMKDRMFFIAVNSALYESADAVRAEAAQSISAGSASGKRHEPSRPNEPPHRDTGNLQDHLETTQPEELMARVTSNAEYSVELEYGTSKMEPRPFLHPARDKVRPRALKILKKRVRDATRRRNT